MSRFELSRLSQAVPASRKISLIEAERPANDGLSQFSGRSLRSRFCAPRGEVAESLPPHRENFRLWLTVVGDPVRSPLHGGAAVCRSLCLSPHNSNARVYGSGLTGGRQYRSRQKWQRQRCRGADLGRAVSCTLALVNTGSEVCNWPPGTLPRRDRLHADVSALDRRQCPLALYLIDKGFIRLGITMR
jgi:hypothetical protein